MVSLRYRSVNLPYAIPLDVGSFFLRNMRYQSSFPKYIRFEYTYNLPVQIFLHIYGSTLYLPHTQIHSKSLIHSKIHMYRICTYIKFLNAHAHTIPTHSRIFAKRKQGAIINTVVAGRFVLENVVQNGYTLWNNKKKPSWSCQILGTSLVKVTSNIFPYTALFFQEEF